MAYVDLSVEAGEGEGWLERGVVSEGMASALAPAAIMMAKWIVVLVIETGRFDTQILLCSSETFLAT